MWAGETRFAIEQLMLKDYRVRYRNMSLGIFWSLLNPLVMMAVFTFVFTKIFKQPGEAFPLFVLCGQIPVAFFGLAWVSGTTSLIENSQLIKKVPLPREVVPVASVLSNAMHLVIQMGLILVMALWFGKWPNIHWLWLPVLWMLFICFVCGLSLITAPVNVYIRDMRYVVESINTVMVFAVPVFYDFNDIPEQYHNLYYFNPVSAVTLAMRNILLHGQAPGAVLMIKLTAVSLGVPLAGLLVFRRLRGRFYNHL